MMDLSVVIVNHETPELLSKCLDSVAAARRAHPELRVETIVVDNGSRDGSVRAIRNSVPAPRVVSLVRNRGFAVAVNRALDIRRGRHVLLLNSDAEIASDLLSGGVELLDESPDVGVLGVALVHPDGRAQRSVHAFPGLATEWLPEPVVRRLRPSGFSLPRSSGLVSSSADRGRDVEAVRGAVFFLRGELLEKLGAFDEGYFFFLEETDYCWRVREAGFRVVHCEALRAIHRLGASSKVRVPLATRVEYHRSLYRFLSRRRGQGVATLARWTRGARNVVVVIGLSIPGAVSRRVRARLSERWGLLLWHLRGCPATPGLAAALLAVDAMKGKPFHLGGKEGERS